MELCQKMHQIGWRGIGQETAGEYQFERDQMCSTNSLKRGALEPVGKHPCLSVISGGRGAEWAKMDLDKTAAITTCSSPLRARATRQRHSFWKPDPRRRTSCISGVRRVRSLERPQWQESSSAHMSWQALEMLQLGEERRLSWRRWRSQNSRSESCWWEAEDDKCLARQDCCPCTSRTSSATSTWSP